MAQPTPIEEAQQRTQPATSTRLTVGLFIAVVFLFWLSLYLYVPTLPMYVQSKTENLALVGVVLSMYGLWQALDRLPIGIGADWAGRRKPFIIGGLALAGLGAWLMGRATGTTELLVGRSVTGLAAGAWVPLVAAFSGLFPAQDAIRASSIITFVQLLGRILGTSVTGPLNEAGGYGLAFWLAAGAAGLAIVAMLPIREGVRPSARPSPAHIGRLIMRPDVLLPSVLAIVSQYVIQASTFGFLPLLSRQLGVNDVTQGLLVSLHLGIGAAGNLLVAAQAKRLGSRRLAYVSFALLTLGLALSALAHSLAALILVQCALGLAYGLGYPVLMGSSIRYVEEKDRGTAMGVFQATYAIGMFGGPAISGLLADALGIRPMFAITAVACFALGLLGSRYLRE